MKKFIFIFMLIFSSLTFAQKKADGSFTNAQKDSLLMYMYQQLNLININTSLKERYKLYQTENIYNFLLLDSKTGIIQQVQWSLDSDNEGTWSINDTDLSFGEGFGSNTFELYPTKNMYQFILLDKTNGRKWHVQWGTDSNKRWIRKIY